MRLVFDEHEKLSLWGKGETLRGWGDLFHACAARDMIPEYSRLLQT
jgi:hypothetical protein